MSDLERIQERLEEMMDSNRSAEEVCAGEPELLHEVKKRWERLQRLGDQIEDLFPPIESTRRDVGPTLLDQEIELPSIDGYRVEMILGRGGMGVVFKALHLKLNRPVALKMLLAGDYAGPMELIRFRREAEAVATLRHPHIVQVHDVGEHAGRPYFTMEFAEAGTLAQKLAHSPLPSRQAAELIASLAAAVQFAHKCGIIHRDLKPANILLTSDGEPKIADFGLARSIDGAKELTLAGARIGTPSYMAPEQAQGKSKLIGPGVDIYALGAILYEMLTGRPPFEGTSAAEIERKSLTEDPVSPKKLNPKTPRDLETICLKCLQKNPGRRYGSAQDLADDLHRFLDGKPVVARPVGLAERALKWALRRPGLAALSLALTLVLFAALALTVRMQREEAARQLEKSRREERAAMTVDAAIAKAYDSRRAGKPDALRVLKDAMAQMNEADMGTLGPKIDEAKKNIRFADVLDDIRTKSVINPVDRFFIPVSSYATFAEEYAKAFAASEFDLKDDPQVLAMRIHAEPLADQIVAALDQWALAAFMLQDEPLQKRLLAITRAADPDPDWGDRLRDAALWKDKNALIQLTDHSLKTPKPPPSHHLTMTSALLHHSGEKSRDLKLMRDAILRRPNDPWLHWEAARILSRTHRHAEAAAYLRVVAALHPSHPWLETHLGAALCLSGDFEEGIRHLRRALALDPTARMFRHNLCIALADDGQFEQAKAECLKAIEAMPDDSWGYHTLGILFFREKKNDLAIPMLQKAVELHPTDKGARWNLASALQMVGKVEEALASYQALVRLQPSNADAHLAVAQKLLELGRGKEALEEFNWLVRELDPAKRKASDPIDGRYLDGRTGQVEAKLADGQFKETVAAAREYLALPQVADPQRQRVQGFGQIASRLAPLQEKIPDFLRGTAPPPELETWRALADWLCHYKKCTAAAARELRALIATTPVEKSSPNDRLNAARMLALAGTGYGVDAAKLSDAQKLALREELLALLTAERSRLAAIEPMLAASSARIWLHHISDLDGVRTEPSLAKLSPAEQKSWRDEWEKWKVFTERDPETMLERARRQADRRQWAEASADYSRYLKESRSTNGEVWFEHAALLCFLGRREEHEKVCKHMAEQSAKGKMRAFLAGRVCTLIPLTPSLAEDLKIASAPIDRELGQARSDAWSLTEQGAILCRNGQISEALGKFDQSLQAEPRPGAAVLNWLWLALAHHQARDEDQARRYLSKAKKWLDPLGNDFPNHADLLGLHRHNWLEAQILRKEVEQRLASGTP